MNKMKRILAVLAAIAVMMSFGGCGTKSNDNGTNTEGTRPRETAVNVDDVDSAVSYSESKSEIDRQTETEPVTEVNPYAYIDIINTDYESCCGTMKHDACVVDGIAYFYAVAANARDFNNLNDEKGFYSCNISTGETKCIVPYEKNLKDICYAGGKIYAIIDKEIRCYDLDGNILKTFSDTAELRWDNDFEIQAVMADGSCVIGYNKFKYHYLISADFTSAKLIGETSEGVHGTTAENPYSYIIGGRGNILYVAEGSMEKVFYGIDVTTNEKTEYAIPENAPGMGAEWVRLFGNVYYKTQSNKGSAIIKMDTGEIIAELDGLADEYYGGEYFYKKVISYSVMAPSSQLSISKYQSDKGEVEKKVLYEVDNNKTLFTVLNAEYYLVTDEYGTFLRNINSDKETQITFE